MAENTLRFAIEALLFASEKPLTMEQLRGALDNLSAGEITKAIEELKKEYESGQRGFSIIEVAGGWRMRTAQAYAPFLKKLFKARAAEKLSKQALETLAIIAYKQPLTRSEIELLRNVNVDGVMATLVEKNMIRVSGRKKAPGCPCLYATTREFLEHFGLKSLADLPKIEELNTPQVKEELNLIEVESDNKTEEVNGIKEAAQQN